MTKGFDLTPDPSPNAERDEDAPSFAGALLRIPGAIGAGEQASWQRIALLLVFGLLGMLVLAALPLAAQEATQPITFDQVNKIARELYCPVCPNETLDACQTQACVQWRDEIRSQLEQGQSEQAIIDSFVRRYGDRVLGTPQNPALRALSLITPFLVAALALAIGVFTFARWRSRPRSELTPAAKPPVTGEYRDQLEQDLRE